MKINMFLFSEIRQAAKPTKFKCHTDFFFLIRSEEQSILHLFLKIEFCIFLLEFSWAFALIGKGIYVCLYLF